jgi:hypothetical protein
MTRNEFIALLKLQDRDLMMCDVHTTVHNEKDNRFAADVVDKNWNVVMNGPTAKTKSAAVQRAIAKYYKRYANN